MFADCDGFLDEMVEILGEISSHTQLLEDSENLVSGYESGLGNTMGIPKDYT